LPQGTEALPAVRSAGRAGYDSPTVRRAYWILAVVIAAAAAVAVVLAAGVFGGSASREDFQTEALHARNRMDASLEFMTRAQTWDDLLERMEAAADQARSAGSDVEDAGAPSDLEEAAAELAVALHALGEELSATAEALDNPDLQGSNIQGLNFDNWTRVQKALAALRAQGIEVPPLERY
jgi:hypothetical protein